ncbi:MAG: aspartate aminotransferase family protein [Chlorobiaceae bacterium]|nr:aspartate aminotransferase family protein [Chlorobiaceae bacterium]
MSGTEHEFREIAGDQPATEAGTAAGGREGIELVRADRRHLIHPQHHPSEHLAPHIWVSGKGARLTSIEGKSYIDGLSGMWNVYVGHGRHELAEAARRQLTELPFATAYAGSTHKPAIELAETLKRLVYPNIEAFYFTLGGSDATDTSIRTARFYWGALGKPEKFKIISRKLSYHGSTVGAAAATGVEEFSSVFGPRANGFLQIDSPYPYRFRTDRTGVTEGVAAADLLEEAILREGPETVAAFIAEPVQGGGGGVIVPQPDYFRRIRDICNRYDVLFISDEVITGFGRTGRWFALEHWDVTPDIVQFAKGITSGYFPLGGTGVSAAIKEVMDSVPADRRWMHGYTCSAHPAGCAVALANIRILEEEKLRERAVKGGERLLGRLGQLLDGHPHVGDIRGLGLLAGIELVSVKSTREPYPAELGIGKKIRSALLSRGLLTRLIDETICLAPPLVVSDDEIDLVADIVGDAIAEVTAKSL